MSDLQRHLASIAAAGHLAALTGGSTAFFNWGNDKEQILDRVALMRLVLIGANLDTAVFWIQPDALPAAYERLRMMSDPDDLIFVEEPS